MRRLVSVLMMSTLFLAGGHAFAESTTQSTYRLQVQKHPGSGACPGYFEVIESSRFYEGGFEVNATAWLQWMAGPFSFTQSQEKSVTWAAKLNSTYKNCRASAAIATINGYPAEGAVHLKGHFSHGYVSFTLDISEYGDMSAITYQNIFSNNPTYRWAVAD